MLERVALLPHDDDDDDDDDDADDGHKFYICFQGYIKTYTIKISPNIFFMAALIDFLRDASARGSNCAEGLHDFVS